MKPWIHCWLTLRKTAVAALRCAVLAQYVNPIKRTNYMKRMHLHVSVDDLNKSISFYNNLFGATPTVEKPDYAKWMLDDPLVNFAISKRGATPGLDHIGIQVDNDAELTEIKQRLEAADFSMQIGRTSCRERGGQDE